MSTTGLFRAAEFVKDVRVSCRQLGNKNLGVIDPTPYLIDDFACAKYFSIGPHGLQTANLSSQWLA